MDENYKKELEEKLKNAKLGTIDTKKCKEGRYVIVNCEIVERYNKEKTKKIGDQLELYYTDPEEKEPKMVSNVKYLKKKTDNQEESKISGLWISFDKENNVQKGSALYYTLKFFNVEGGNFTKLIGKECNIIEGPNGYPIIKLY